MQNFIFKSWTVLLLIFLDTQAFSYSVCQSQNTLLHYAKTQCHSTERPYLNGQRFSIQSMLIEANHPAPQTRPTVVLIPGGPGESARGFRQLLQSKELLSGMVHNLKLNAVLYDPRATGESQFPDQSDSSLKLSTENMSYRLMVEDLEALVDHYQPENLVLMTHSMGSIIAMKYIERNPGKASKLIMISPLPTIRNQGDINLWIYGADFPLLNQHLQSVNDPIYSQDMIETFNIVNDVSIQQQKAQILGVNKWPEFKGILTNLLRVEFIKRIGDIDQKNPGLLQFLNGVKSDFLRIAPYESLVTPELRAAQLSMDDVYVATDVSWHKIANFLICTESINESEKDKMSIYDGLVYRFRCPVNSETRMSVSEVDPRKIELPTLIFSGTNDSQVPYFMQKKLAQNLPDSRWELVTDGGHFPPLKEPMLFYQSLEKFLAD